MVGVGRAEESETFSKKPIVNNVLHEIFWASNDKLFNWLLEH
jgi:hypothetical protein